MATPITVSFPVIGGPIPHFPCGPETFVDHINQRGVPHWLFHLSVRARQKSGARNQSSFLPLDSELIRRFAQALDLAMSFRVDVREFLHGDLWSSHRVSPYAFGFPRFFAADSSHLALAIGLVAAATGRRLPPWVLSSGAGEEAKSPSFCLTRTGKIEEKVRLAFGLDPGYHLGPVLDHLYKSPSTRVHLGPRSRRSEPGRIKMFLMPCDVDTDPLSFVNPLQVERLPLSLENFGQPDFNTLMAFVNQTVEDDLLLVQVPTVFHALHFLGYQEVHPATRVRRDQLLAEPIRVFRVRHEQPDRPPFAINTASDVQQELAEIPYLLRARGARDLFSRLRVILERCRRHLECFSGDIAILSPDPGWLRVVTRRGLENLPHFIPTHPAPGLGPLSDRKTRTVPDTATDAEYLAAGAVTNPLRAQIGERRFAEYQHFLTEIGAYVKMPLIHDNRVLGAIYLHRREIGPFEDRKVLLAEGLADWAAHEVAAFLREEELVYQRTASLRGTGSVGALATLMAAPTRWELALRLGRELAELTQERSGAYRVCVRLWICESVLIPIGYVGNGDPEEQGPPLSLEEDSAAGHAIHSGTSYIVADTGTNGVHLDRIPPEPLSHAAIILRVGGRILGVLNVDWDRLGACDPPMQNLLETLAGRYAAVLKNHLREEMFARVESCAAAFRTEELASHLRLFVCNVVHLVGGREAHLFLRSPHTGRLELEAAWLRNQRTEPAPSPAINEGLLGWIMANNRALRIADIDDPEEVRSLAVPLSASDQWWRQGQRPCVFLGAPVANGSQVLGVLAVTAAGPNASFDIDDQGMLLAAALRLAGRLSELGPVQGKPDQALPLLTQLSARVVSAATEDVLVPVLIQVGNILVDGFHAETGWLWLADSAENLFRCAHGWQIPREEVPELPLAVIAEVMGDDLVKVVTNASSDQSLTSLLEHLEPVERRETLSRAGQCVVALTRHGTPFAAFFLSLPSPEVCDPQAAENFGQALRRVFAHSAHEIAGTQHVAAELPATAVKPEWHGGHR